MSEDPLSGQSVGSHASDPPESAQFYQPLFDSSTKTEAGPSNYHGIEDEEILFGDGEDDLSFNRQLKEYDDSDEDSNFETRSDITFSDDEDLSDENSNEKNKKGKETLRENRLHQSPVSPALPQPQLSYRPNRYTGPPATWKYWTKFERQLIESLEETRSRDLSAHLFNSFALKKRASKLKKKSPGDAQLCEETIAGIKVPTFAFVPNKAWTAWPLPPSLVPRTHEANEKDEVEAWTLRSLPDPRLSGVLEELLIAKMLNIAKIRFLEREWETSDAIKILPGHNDDEPTEDESGYKSEIEKSTFKGQRPVIQTDDVSARRQLRPLARNIIVNFDRLLFGLHIARKASITAQDSSEIETESESGKSTLSSRRKRRLTNASAISQLKGRKRLRTAYPACSEEGNWTEDAEKSHDSIFIKAVDDRVKPQAFTQDSNPLFPGESSQNPRRQDHNPRSRTDYSKRNLGLRDWSEVLGLATLTGCSQSAVMRAAKRCADLFGEDMAFTTLEEGRVELDKNEPDNYKWSYMDHNVEVAKENISHRGSLYSHCDSWSKSLLEKEYTKENPTAADYSKSRTTEVDLHHPAKISSRVKGKGHRQRRDVICPVKGCPRSLKGFSRTWNLNLHLKRKHHDLVDTKNVKNNSGQENTPEVGIDTN